MHQTYLSKQSDDGSWQSREAGPIYGTSMMALAFTVPLAATADSPAGRDGG
jgi:hypothetical protein